MRLGGRRATASAVVLAVMLASAVAVPVGAQVSDDPCDWPMWGRTVAREFSTTCEGLTPENAGDLRRIWYFNTYDVVTATPAVVGNTVYVGDWSGRFYALNRANGKKRWVYKIKLHPRVYAGQIVSSAAVATIDGVSTVFFGGGKTLYALNAKNGKLRWKHELPGPGGGSADYTEIESSPVVIDDKVIVGWDVHNSPDLPAGVVALDAKTGDEDWRTELAPSEGDRATAAGCADVWSSPSVDVEQRVLFVGTGNCTSSPEGWGRYAEAIVAVGLDDGEVRWSYQPHGPNNDDFDFAGAPNLFESADGRALVGLGNKDAVYYVIDRTTGEEVWQTKVAEPGLADPGSNFSTGGFIGPTAVADGVIVGGTAIGGAPFLHALDATTGEIIWQQPEAAATYGAAAVANGVVIIGGTDFTLRALDLKTGDILWSDDVLGAVSGGAAISGDDVFAVAGIREPALTDRSRTSGVYRYSTHGKPLQSATPKTDEGPTVLTTAPGAANQPCVASTCDVQFDLIEPPAGLNPTMTLKVSLDPWKVEVHTTGLGPPEAWLKPGTSAARAGATRYGVFISERDDRPVGGLLCVLDDEGSCRSRKIPRRGATYNRITILAITESDKLPSPQEGVNRLIVTRSFNPVLTPIPKKKKESS